MAEAMTRLGIVDRRHPVDRLIAIGMVKQDGRKMSKSAGNTVDLATLIDRHGADVLRLAILSSAAPDQDINWSDDLLTRAARLIGGVTRLFRRRAFAFAALPAAPPRDSKAQRKLADWVAVAEHKVTGSLARCAFHVAVQQIAFLLERIAKVEAEMTAPGDAIALACAARAMLTLIAPLAPHIAEDLWEKSGGAGLLAAAAWPLPVARAADDAAATA